MRKENERNNKQVFSGFVAGIVITLIVIAAVKGVDFYKKGAGPDNKVLAKIDGAVLTENELRKAVGGALIPVESDRYVVFMRGIESWFNEELLNKEARTQGISRQDLDFKQIWSRVKVSSGDVLEYYNNNRALYNQPLDAMRDALFKMLREKEYQGVKEKYLEGLKEKYHAKVLLEKPAAFLENAVLPPSAVPVIPSAVLPPAQPSPVKPAAQPPPPAPAAPQPAAVPPAPLSVADYAGQPTRGPENAPVVVASFSDFHCPFCSQGAKTVSDIVKNYNGKIREVWFHFPLSMHQGSDQTHMASQCAADQGKFWEYHDKLFEKAGGFKGDDALVGLARDLKLDEKKFKECLSSGKYKDMIQKNITKGQSFGVRGTPSFFVNGQMIVGAQPYDTFKVAVENALNPGKPPTPLPGGGGARPAPPQNVVFDDLKGHPAQGPENAPITIVEFSDFHCPFCSRVSPTITDLMKNYAGKIRRVWRQFPLSFHQGAEQTAAASECAAEQGKFWEFHDKLFEKPGAFKGDDALIGLAKDLKLEENKFTQCLKSGKYKDLVQKDIAKGGMVGVSGTPAFFINGQFLSGAQPYASFSQIIDAELAKKK